MNDGPHSKIILLGLVITGCCLYFVLLGSSDYSEKGFQSPASFWAFWKPVEGLKLRFSPFYDPF